MTDPKIPASGDDAQENRDIAALSYVWILSVVVYFSKKESAFVRFHAKQGMVLFGLSIAVWFIPVLGRFLELVVLALAVLGFLAAAQGQWKELPLIGALARGDVQGTRRSWRDIIDGLLHGWKEVKSDVMPKASPPMTKTTQPPSSPAPVAPAPASPVDSVGPIPPIQP